MSATTKEGSITGRVEDLGKEVAKGVPRGVGEGLGAAAVAAILGLFKRNNAQSHGNTTIYNNTTIYTQTDGEQPAGAKPNAADDGADGRE